MEHLRAAILYFRNFVAREAAWLGRASNAASASPADGEFACSVCLRSLANVVLIQKAVKGAHYCGNCAPPPSVAWPGSAFAALASWSSDWLLCKLTFVYRWRRQRI